MTLRVVGAGLGRTGTHSLKLALEELVGQPCYHMVEVFSRPDHVREWQRAIHDQDHDWDAIFSGFGAAVDWPTGAFYEDLMHAYPDAIVLLSTRSDAEAWWTSANATIFAALGRIASESPEMEQMLLDMLSLRFTPQWQDHDASVAAYDEHNARVRELVPADRLVEWQPGDGWAPLCRALDVAEPDGPFPHVNSTADFRAMIGLDA